MAMVDYYSKYADKINKQYDDAIGGLDKTQEADRLKAQQQYQDIKNQASVNAGRNRMALKEMMANQGLFKSGDNITASMQIENNRSGNINQANLDEQNYYAGLDQEKLKQINSLNLNRQTALQEALRQHDAWQYRDSRDVIDDARYKEKFDYEKSQDALAQSNWEKQFAAAAARAASGGSGYSSRQETAQTKSNIQSQFVNAMNTGGLGYGYEWLTSNKDDIVDAVGTSEYNKMMDTWRNSYSESTKNFRRSKSQYGG